MAWFNPNPVSFQPSRGIIDASGAVGRSLYEIYQDNVKNAQIQQRLDEKQRTNMVNEAVSAGKFEADEKQRDITNKYNANVFAETKRANAAREKYQADMLAAQIASNQANRDYHNIMLALKQKELASKVQREQIVNDTESDTILKMSNFYDALGENQMVLNRLKDIGAKKYTDSQGLAEGTWENIKGMAGIQNNNTENDNILQIMSDAIYNEKVRRDTNARRETHDNLYKLPAWYKSDGVNAINGARIVNDFYDMQEAKINADFNKKLGMTQVMNNPVLAAAITAKKDADLAKIRADKKNVMDYFRDGTNAFLPNDGKKKLYQPRNGVKHRQ